MSGLVKRQVGKKPLLSVLVCGVPSRLTQKFPSLIRNLDAQASGKSVEILALVDNRSMTTGEKRNHLVKIARGNYLTFVDDDDRVTSNYIDAILNACRQTPAPQVIVYDVWVSGYMKSHGLPDRRCSYDINFQNVNLADRYERKPNHLMVWRSEIAKSVQFPHVTRGEDTAWADRIFSRYQNLRQYRIPLTLYYYDFDANRSVTQAREVSAEESSRKLVPANSELSRDPTTPDAPVPSRGNVL